jgi:hypothetical protein
MRRPLIAVTTVAAGAVLATGLLAAAPALAAGRGPGGTGTTAACPYAADGTGARAMNGRGGGTGNGAGMGSGMGSGMGLGMGRQGTGASTSDPLAGLTQGTLSPAQKTSLAGMAEEEKLAHDVYLVLGKTSGDARFSRITVAEARHLTEIRALLTRYGVADPTAGKVDGVFADAAAQKMYTDFIARGDDSPATALAVGVAIEQADIAALTAARAGVTAPDVLTVYTRLSNGSSRHLRAFGG